MRGVVGDNPAEKGDGPGLRGDVKHFSHSASDIAAAG
jgi:hypothetical protein